MATIESLKLTADGGIVKDITRRGAGGCPKVGDEGTVPVHATQTVDDAVGEGSSRLSFLLCGTVAC
jgi:hypothetical protein